MVPLQKGIPMPDFHLIVPTAVVIGVNQPDRFALRAAVSVVLTALNAGVIAVSGRTLYLATAYHPIWFAGLTVLFAVLLGSLASVWIVTLCSRPR
jgi:hypothetical protein